MKRLCLPAVIALAIAASAPAHADNSITLTGTIRDFNSYGTTFDGVAGQPDFEHYGGDDRGIVQSLLGADGKPVYNDSISHTTITSAASFYQWYHDDPTVNMTGTINITLNQISPSLYQFSSQAFFPIDGQLL